ncbi:MAG: CBS domain-containing protein [Desulfuromonadales bacterium]|nr:CBS domain-containing protein [Desulfuromonadales bacterium]
MLKAKDIMTTQVYTVAEETGVDELARLFSDTGVDTLPVVDGEGKLLGVVSQTDLVEQDKPLHIPTVITIFDWVLYLESEKNFKEEVDRITAQTVKDLCTREVITCTPETPVSDIAALMVEHGVHLIPVLEDGRVIGVVARLDIIRSMGR